MIEHMNPNIQTDLHGDSASSLKSVSTSILQFQISKITNVDLVRCKGIYTHTDVDMNRGKKNTVEFN